MKTALARNLDQGSADMEPAEERKFVEHVAQLRSDVRHLQNDVTEIKSEIKYRFERVDKQFEKVDERFKAVDARFDGVNTKLNEIVGMIASAKLWAYGLYVGLGTSLLYIVGRAAKWF